MQSESSARSGTCACGAVKLTLSGQFAGPYQCFCRQCQQASGGNGAIFVIAPREAVAIEGETRSHAAATASGKAAIRSFCPHCGTAVFSEPGSMPGQLVVKAGMFGPDARLGPVQAAFWTDEAPEWAMLPPQAKAFPTQP